MTQEDPDKSTRESGLPKQQGCVILGNEIRVEIIKVVGDAYVQNDEKVSFTDLRSRIDNELDSGNLNYHLQKLVGHFLKKIDGAYALRSEGVHLYKSLRTAGLDRRVKRISLDVQFNCHYCQNTVEAIFYRGIARLKCPNCSYLYLGFPIEDIASIPELIEDRSAAFEHISKYLHHGILAYSLGICRTCGLELHAELVDPSEAEELETDRNKVYVRRWCEFCGSNLYLFLGVALISNPNLLSFCYDHDIDLLSTPFWEFEFAATDKYVNVHSKDPWEVSLDVTFGGDTLELVVDGNLNVIDQNLIQSSSDSSKRKSDCGRYGEPIKNTIDLFSIGNNDKSIESQFTGEGDAILPDKAECLEYLRRQRWPIEVTCPHCDSNDTIKKGRTSKQARRYRCRNCGTTFNDLTNTIFAGHQLSLPEMFFIVESMEVTNTAQIARRIDRSYQAVLDFVHEVQESRSEGDNHFI